MKIFFFLFTLLAAAQCGRAQIDPMHQVTHQGMTVDWAVEGEYLRISMIAPTAGWVAVGLNEQEGLPGTNLIMAAVHAKGTTLSDRYIVAPGDHRSVTALGGTPVAQLLSGVENDAGTKVVFTLPLRAVDKFHFDLSTGKRFYLLMAFSREDDFQHHSMMRTSIEISI